MYIEPKILYRNYGDGSPIYKCTCGHTFQRMELLSNKRINGNFNYCPKCKNKFHFKET